MTGTNSSTCGPSRRRRGPSWHVYRNAGEGTSRDENLGVKHTLTLRRWAGIYQHRPAWMQSESWVPSSFVAPAWRFQRGRFTSDTLVCFLSISCFNTRHKHTDWYSPEACGGGGGLWETVFHTCVMSSGDKLCCLDYSTDIWRPAWVIMQLRHNLGFRGRSQGDWG